MEYNDAVSRARVMLGINDEKLVDNIALEAFTKSLMSHYNSQLKNIENEVKKAQLKTERLTSSEIGSIVNSLI